MRVTFLAKVQKTNAVLMRIVSLFHRLALNVEVLTFHQAPEPTEASVTITVGAEADQSLRIEAHLLKIVEVLDVEVQRDCQTKANLHGKNQNIE